MLGGFDYVTECVALLVERNDELAVGLSLLFKLVINPYQRKTAVCLPEPVNDVIYLIDLFAFDLIETNNGRHIVQTQALARTHDGVHECLLLVYFGDGARLAVQLHSEKDAWVLSILLILVQKVMYCVISVYLKALIWQLSSRNDFIRHKLDETQLSSLVNDVEGQQVDREVQVKVAGDDVFEDVLAVLSVRWVVQVVLVRDDPDIVIEQLNEILQVLLAGNKHI